MNIFQSMLHEDASNKFQVSGQVAFKDFLNLF